MMDPSSRPARKVQIADHIWGAFEEMASQMGSDRDALINQAMFMFARLNGFLDSAAGASAPGGAMKPTPAAAAAPRPAPAARPAPGGAPPMLKPVQQPPPPQQGAMDDDPVRREVQERVLETAAELERLIKSKNQGNQPAPDQSIDQDPDDGGGEVDVDMGGEAGGAPALYMMLEGGELDRIAKERFVIGRGKHCDFVINSGKVSREHAVIVRDGGEFFLEDLGSSNGTWFNKQRIKRRKIEDGDEYFICSEKVKFVYR